MDIEHDKVEEQNQSSKEIASQEGCALTEGKVHRIVKQLEGKISQAMLLNLKYIDQSFHMKKEMRLQEKKTKKK